MELLFKHLVRRELLWFLLLFYSTLFKFVQGVVTQIPSHACVGEDVTVNCDLSVPVPNNNFRTNFIEFIVGSNNDPISDTVVNTVTGDRDGVDLSRLTAFSNNSFSNDKIIRGSITLSSYTASDAGIRLGCAAIYFLSGNTGPTGIANETTLLTPAAPPSAPSMLSISSNIDPNTCSATVSLNWIPPSYTNRTVDLYYLSLQNGTALESISAPANSYSHNTDLLLDTVYAYSVHASSCAGNSTAATSYLDPINSYSLTKSSQSVCLAYNNDTGTLTISWGLSTSTQPPGVSGLDISYSLQLLYSHSRQGVTYTYTNSSNFTLPSSQLSYNTNITVHNFTQLDGVETNITTNLMIVQQCGQSFSGTAMDCFFNSNNPPTPPTSTAPSSNSSSNSSQQTTAPSNVPVMSTISIAAIVGGIIGGCLLFIIIIIIILLILVICICCLKKRRNQSLKPPHIGMKECDFPAHKESEQYSTIAEKTNTNEEMNYAQIDHSIGKGSAVRPPAMPPTNYAELSELSSQATHYSTVSQPN